MLRTFSTFWEAFGEVRAHLLDVPEKDDEGEDIDDEIDDVDWSFFGSIIVNDCSSDLLAVKCAYDALINERLRISAEVASDEAMRFKALYEDLRSVWGMYRFNCV